MKIDINDANYLLRRDSVESRVINDNELFTRLNTALRNAGFSPSKDGYSILDVASDDCFVICKDGDFWSVSYFERGLRLRPALFFNLEDAIQFFLLKVTKSKVISF